MEVQIQHPADVIAAQQAARTEARSVGFLRPACAELMIVASELSSNILKYGKRGVLLVEAVQHPVRGPGVRFVAEDEGPPFRSWETALLDGFDDEKKLDPTDLVARRGTGNGLGAVRRLTHELSCEPREIGKAVIAIRWLRAPRHRR